jgi:SAM-dependent methyltransferase
MDLQQHREEWEKLAELDPLWAILSRPDRRGNRWEPDEFFATGRVEVDGMMDRLRSLGYPRQRGAVLDFGCGAGRLTRALADHFDRCVGVDISQQMVDLARRFHADRPACEFLVNSEPHLGCFADQSFDLVYSSIVLQHLPSQESMLGYLREFVRVLRRSGVLCFQLPAAIRWWCRLRLRRHLYLGLSRIGFSHAFLHQRLGLTTISMRSVPVETMTGLLRDLGLTVLAVDERDTGPVRDATYLAVKQE